MTGARDQERWERVQALFHDVVDCSESERRAVLDLVTDRSLVAEVIALVESDAGGSSPIDTELAQLAHRVIGESVPAALLEQRFGPYRLERLLGEGGMGAVYLGRRSDLDSVAAIKILRDASLSPSRRDRFAAEQRTLAQLRHPTIAQLYDADTLPDGTPWFAMEYVEGLPITEYCRARGSSLRARLLLLRAVAEAVQHAHGQAVIHRDLKPSNILVKSDGTVKLLDFGIAKHLADLEAESDRTRTGLRLMTPAYAAPEQIRGDRVGIQTDVYSLGVILYELLAGRLPFDLTGRSPGEMLTIVVENPVGRPSASGHRLATSAADEPLRLVSRDGWADLDVLCLTAMHRDPARRYRTVDAVIRDIDHFLDGQPLDAQPDSWGYRLGKFVRRNRRVVTSAGVAAVVIVTLVGFYTIRLATARTEALAEAARTQRIQRFMLDLFQGGDDEAGPADSLRVITLIDRGALEAAGLSREPAVQAELYQTLGGIYQQLGNLPKADSLLGTALDRRRAIFGPDHAETAKSLVALGLLRVDQARLDSALTVAREAVVMTRRHRPADHPDVAAAITALTKVLEEQGQYDEAIGLLDTLAAVQGSTIEPRPELAATLYGLANNHFYAGHYQIADSLSRRVLAVTRQLYGDRHPNVALNLANLGAVQQELGRYPEAERYHREALDIVTAWYGPNHPRTAAAITMVGRALVYQKRYDEATAMLTEALVVRERVFGPEHPTVASTLNEIGSIAYQRDRYDEALAAWNRVLAIYRRVYHDKHYLIGIALSNLASVSVDMKDYPRAERQYRDAIAMFTATLGAEHLNVAIGRIKLGRALLRQNRYLEATRESQAGYDLMVQRTDPAVSFLKAARTDLMTGYGALGQHDKAAKFRAELMATAPPK